MSLRITFHRAASAIPGLDIAGAAMLLVEIGDNIDTSVTKQPPAKAGGFETA